VRDQWQEGIEFEVAAGTGKRQRRIMAEREHGCLRNSFGYDRIDLAGHD
jgi:hypothetical protein